MSDENEMLLKEILQRSVAEEANPAPSCSANESASASDQPIQLKLDFNQSLVTYSIKSNTKLGKLFSSFYKRNFIQPGTVRFLVDGHRLHENDTAESQNLIEGDIISVYGEQVGGDRLEIISVYGEQVGGDALEIISVYGGQVGGDALEIISVYGEQVGGDALEIISVYGEQVGGDALELEI